MMASGAPSPHHSSVQFLNTVLSQRGPSALPYDEDVKWLIRQQLVSLIQEFPSLQAKTAIYNHTDGRTVNLLQAEGTVPMVYQDVVYNIPVVIWLLEAYPKRPPCVYVTPTRDMIIKRSHRHVDPSGLVSIPYLHGWVYPSSNLVELARNLSILFGSDPPLYTKQSAPQPRPSPSSRPMQAHSQQGQIPGSQISTSPVPSHLGPSHAGALVRPTPPPRGYPYGNNSLLPVQSPSSQPPKGSSEPSEVFRRSAINRLVEMLHGDMTDLRRKTEAEIEGLFSTQSSLRQREEHLEKGLKELHNEKEGLEQKLQLVLTNTDVLETWLRNNEGKLKSDVDIDDVFQPSDPLSKQLLELTAADLAIEDTLYSLDRAVQQGSIPADTYLKNIRVLSREQFFHRATTTRVRAAQMQSQVANMAARTSPYAY